MNDLKVAPPVWKRVFARRNEYKKINVGLIDVSNATAHHLLLFLVACDECHHRFHTYASIAKHTRLSVSTVQRSAKYLRDVLRVIDWIPGHGGVRYAGVPKANLYRIDYRQLAAMRDEQREQEPKAKPEQNSTAVLRKLAGECRAMGFDVRVDGQGDQLRH